MGSTEGRACIGRNVAKGNGIIPNEQFNALIADEASLTPLVFEGYYKDLLTILASHELRLDIFPGLRREDNWWSVFVAVTLAACDIASNSSVPTSLAADIQRYVIDQYAVPSHYDGLKSIAEGISDLICQIPVLDWKMINGPMWARINEFKDLTDNALARHAHLPVIISADYIFVVNWDHD